MPVELLPKFTTRNYIALDSHGHGVDTEDDSDGLLSSFGSPRPRRAYHHHHNRSRLRTRKALCSATGFLVLCLLGFLWLQSPFDQVRDTFENTDIIEDLLPYDDLINQLPSDTSGDNLEFEDELETVPLGQSTGRYDREFFWWEQFPTLHGFFRGRKTIVPFTSYLPEQQYNLGQSLEPESIDVSKSEPELEPLPSLLDAQWTPCYLDEQQEILPPSISAYRGLPQGFPAPLLGSHRALGINEDICYDRINRFAQYGYGFTRAQGGLGLELRGDSDGLSGELGRDFSKVNWSLAQQQCSKSNSDLIKSPTAFVIRTWNTYEYTEYDILMLRAIISELALSSGGQYTVHFLIHVQNDSIPIWDSPETYDEVLKASLPDEFQGMGTLWSVPQMKVLYPPPFPDSIINFSGGDIYEAYRSLHFPFQHFASNHPEYDYFWHWEMDIRVTGHYHDLLHQISTWADKQPKNFAWERSSQFFVPSLFNNSYDEFANSINETWQSLGEQPISGPQLSRSHRFEIPNQNISNSTASITDLITFNPLFDPSRTQWAFRDDITGYRVQEHDTERPPTRAALITASRLSRRLLLLMHEETLRNKHTMFPEMYPASIALHYGLKAVHAPLPVYFDRDWPAEHANEIFNNAPVGAEGRAAGMDHGEGHFHGPGGSVFGPGEHVFRGASYYSNALFSGYLWRRWLGREHNNDEIDWELGEGGGRMCLPMMVLHPIKYE